MQCKQAHEYAHIKCNQSKFMSLLPLLVCFSCPRNFDPSLFSNVAPSLSIFMSNLLSFHILSLPLHNLSLLQRLSYLCTISPPLSSISIKGELLIDAKVYIWGRWLRLESCIFYGYLHDCWNDTTCNLYHLHLMQGFLKYHIQVL